MTSATSNKQRDITFDVMKGIGILMMLLGHVYETRGTVGHFVYTFHMPMFFIVAGYFSKTCNEVGNVRDTIKKYAKRLCLPYLFVMLITLAWFIFFGATKGEWGCAIRETLSLFWAEPTPLPTPFGNIGIGVVWFVLALFWAKCLLLILGRWEQLMLPISLLFALAAIALHGVFPYIPWCILMGFTALPFVCIGWYARHNSIPLWIKIVCVTAWILTIVLKSTAIDMYSYTWGCFPLNILGACGGTYCLCLLSRWIAKHTKLTARIFAQLGVLSLAIMCFHCFELTSHMGNHIRVLLGLELPIWAFYLFRYALTILLAIAAIHTPKLKKLFV